MPVGLLQLDTERDVVYNNARLLDILYGSEPLDSATASEPTPVVPGEQEAAVERQEGPAPTVKTLLQTLTEESTAQFDEVLDEVLAEGVDRDVEVDIVRPSGAWRRALMSLRPLSRASGEISGAITCVLDVTDSARARQELEHRATYDPLTHVPQPLLDPRRCSETSSHARTRRGPASSTSTSTSSSRSTTPSATPPATSC